MMNFLLTSDRGKAPLNRSTHSCRYCKKAFNNHQALGGHLRSHRNMMRKYPTFRSHNHSTDENHRGNETRLILPSYLSYAPNRDASSRAVALSGGLMPAALPLSRPFDMVNTNNPLGLAPIEGSTSSCHFDVEAVRYFISRFPYLSQRFLQIMKDHNPSNHSESSCVTCSLCPCYMMNNILKYMDCIPRPGLGINKFLGIENPVFAGLLPLSSSPYGQLTDSICCPNEYIKALTSGRVKKHCLSQPLANGIMTRALKRPRLSSSSQVSWVAKPPQKELLLFKDADNSSSGSEIPTHEGEKNEANLDLSLHL